jgi:hypothetical protein
MGQIIQAARRISQTCKFLTWLFQFINFYALNVVVAFTIVGVILKTKSYRRIWSKHTFSLHRLCFSFLMGAPYVYLMTLLLLLLFFFLFFFLFHRSSHLPTGLDIKYVTFIHSFIHSFSVDPYWYNHWI